MVLQSDQKTPILLNDLAMVTFCDICSEVRWRGLCRSLGKANGVFKQHQRVRRTMCSLGSRSVNVTLARAQMHLVNLFVKPTSHAASSREASLIPTARRELCQLFCSVTHDFLVHSEGSSQVGGFRHSRVIFDG